MSPGARLVSLVAPLCVVLASSPARADSIGDRITELQVLGTLALLGGGASAITGTVFVVNGLRPCPGQDCSTRPLGVIFGLPLLVLGVGLVVGGVVFFDSASRLEKQRSAAVTVTPFLARGAGGMGVTGRF